MRTVFNIDPSEEDKSHKMIEKYPVCEKSSVYYTQTDITKLIPFRP